MELENAENQTSEETRADEMSADAQNELNEPCWSVVSFQKCVASGLTYEQAASKLAALAAEKVSGLCIVTDEAANRINEAEARAEAMA